MAVVGHLMDRVRIRKATWAILYLVASDVVFVTSIASYPTIERALSRNGSWWTYEFFALNVGLFVAILLSFLGKGLAAARQGMRGATDRRDAGEGI